ncbi:MAG: pilus assembly protein PilM, partial [Gammaproteobacteria bacterium]
MALFSRKKPPLLGLDISSTAVKLLELNRSGGRYRVESYAVEPLPPNSVVEKNIADVEAVGETIRRAVKRSGSRTRDAAVAVAGSAVITKVITMSGSLTDEEMESQIELEADQYIPY